LVLILPPIEIQNQFEEIVKKILEIEDQIRISSGESGNLFASLIQQAFRGDL